MARDIIDPIPNTLAEIEKNRLDRELRRRKKEAKSLTNKFEEGLSIFTAPQDEHGKKKILKEKFIEALTYDVDGIMQDDQYTPEQIDRIRRSLSRMSAASGLLISMDCEGGDVCPFASRCPFAKEGLEPLGKPCPQEHILFTEILMKYIESLEIDPSNMMELAYANELAETEILIMRANKSLSGRDHSSLIVDGVTMVRGQPVTTQQVSPYLEARDSLVKRRERIIKLMVGDRQEKYKQQAALKQKNIGDESVQQSKKASMLIEAKFSKSINELSNGETGEKPLTAEDIIKGELNIHQEEE